MTTVYVVMGNDYPEAVFSDEQIAVAFVAKMRPKPGEGTPADPRRIHWRYYPFVLDKDPS